MKLLVTGHWESLTSKYSSALEYQNVKPDEPCTDVSFKKEARMQKKGVFFTI